MKLIKLMGLAAVAAAALMAFVGAATASADVICKKNETSLCKTANATGEISSSLQAGKSAILETTSGETLVTCTTSNVAGTIEEQGKGIEPAGPITTLEWGGCSSTTDTVTKGRIKVKTTEVPPGSGLFEHDVIGVGNEVTVSIFGVSCTYGTGTGTTLGQLLVGEPATLNISTIVKKAAGGFLCPSEARWTANYQVTSPAALWVSTEYD